MKITKWIDNSYLPSSTWKNGNLIRTSEELYEEYPSHATEWAGIWRKYIPITGITLDRTSLVMTEGDVVSLSAVIMPEEAEDKNVSWISSDESIVSVDQTGKIEALNIGTAVITVMSSDNTEVKAECMVTIVKTSVAQPEIESGTGGR